MLNQKETPDSNQLVMEEQSRKVTGMQILLAKLELSRGERGELNYQVKEAQTCQGSSGLAREEILGLKL